LQVPARGSIEPPYGIGISLGGIGKEIFNVQISLPGHPIAPPRKCSTEGYGLVIFAVI
jgi:hypothetical protein